MKSFMFRLLFAFMLTLAVPAMAAPGLIHYQGRLTNPSGQPITTPVDITFTFWSAETGGVQLGSGFSDTDTVTPDASGIYSTLIGDDPGNLIPASIFAGNSIWLNVRINLENLTPRGRIVSVGYALRSAHADTADTATTATRSLVATQADNAGKLGGQPLSALAAKAHTHAAGDTISGMFSDALVTNTLTVSSAGSVDGGAIKSGTVAAARIDAAIARVTGILPAVLAGDGPGSTLDADKLDGKESSAFAATAHAHKAGDITSGMFSDALVTNTLTVSALGSVDGSAIKSGTVAAARIDAAIARDIEIMPAVLAGDGTGSTLDADTLDGQQASAFMSAASDNWVNTSGDTMTGALTVTGSSITPLVDVTNSNIGAVDAIRGTASGTGAVTNYGGSFSAAGYSGIGVFGVASGGEGRGVFGNASATGAVQNYGGSFEAAGKFGRGVSGTASGTGAVTNYGGYFSAAGDSGRGVYGYATATGAASNRGGVFYAAGNTGLGVWGGASGTSGRGVYGVASATGDVENYGGYFEAAGDSGRGVFGTAIATGAVTNYGGIFSAAGDSGRGVVGTAIATGAVTNYGGVFYAAGHSGRGVYGAAIATGAGENYGGRFEAAGDTGSGVYGTASGTSGVGVYGYASATGAVTNYGGSFQAAGNGGFGVYAVASGTSGCGVYAEGKGYDFYAGGTGTNYGPFTGAHEVQFDAGFPSGPKPGLIVVTAGSSKVRRDESGQVSISSTLPTVRLADRPNAKAVFGVLVREMPLPEGHWYKSAAAERFGVVNALGEGRVWVCSAAGPIEMGDYITTSAVPGYGQKQADDLQHTYTVSKVIESVDWDAVTETIEHGGQVYKVYLIAVVYTCG